MVEFSTRQVLVSASPADCFAVILDFESYPQWAPDIKEARVLRRDDSGAGGLVAYRAAAMGRSVTYTLKYFYGTNPLRVAWRLTEGDQVRHIDGEYELVSAGEDGTKTLITYSLSAELAVAIPGFVKRRAKSRIMQTALDQLRRRIESVSAQPTPTPE